MNNVRKEALDIAKIVFPIVLAIFGAAWHQSIQIREMERFGWTLHDQREWAKEVHELNPGVKVPDPNDIFWNTHNDRTKGSTKHTPLFFPDSTQDSSHNTLADKK